MENQYPDLAGKAILVTGASSGIGAATALALGRAGARVALAARRRESLERLASKIRAEGGEALPIPTDIAKEDEVREAVATVVARYGRLDGAFNNAGTLGKALPLHELATADLDEVLRVNVFGVFWSMKYEIEAMLKAGGGAIVNNASIVAEIAMPNLSPYNASKHAVLGLTRTAALECFQKGIRINAVNPGPIETPMAESGFGGLDKLRATTSAWPGGRPGKPEEIAGPVLFLLSNAASYISGQGIAVDGGYTAQ